MKRFYAKITDTATFETEIEIKGNMTSLGFGRKTRGNASDIIPYGIYSGVGEISFYDVRNQFNSLYNEIQRNPSLLPSLLVTIYSEIDGVSKSVQTLSIEDIDYDAHKKFCTLKLFDNLISWQNIPIKLTEIFYTCSALELLNYVLYDMAGGISYHITDTARYFMQKTTIYCPIIENGNLWSTITKICQITHCYLFWDNGLPYIIHENDIKPRKQLFPSTIFSIERENSLFKTSLRKISLKSTPIIVNNGDLLSYKPKTIKLYENIRDIGATIAFYQYDWDYVGGDTAINPDTDISRTVSGDFDIKEDSTYTQNIHCQVTIRPKGEVKIFKINSIEFWGNVFSVNTKTKTETREYTQLSVSNQRTEMNGDGSITLYFDANVLWRVATNNITYVEHRIIEDMTISVYASYYRKNEQVEFFEYGNGLTDFEIPSNEFMQTGNLFDDAYRVDKSFVKAIKESYGNGFDSIIVECSYDPELQIFQEVVPYISKNNEIIPYATDKKGDDVSYKIIGIDYSYDGYARQKLYLQSVTPDISYDVLNEH